MTGIPATEAEYYEAVGRLVQNASVAEMLMSATFQAVTGLVEGLSHTIFYTNDAFPTRRNLINRCLHVMRHDDEDKALVDEILKLTEVVQNQRNELAHSFVVHSSESTDPRTRVKLKSLNSSHHPVSKPYIESLLNKSVEALTRASNLYIRLSSKRGLPPLISLSLERNEFQLGVRHQNQSDTDELLARPHGEPPQE